MFFLQKGITKSALVSITNLHKAVDSEHEAHFPPALRFLPSEIIRSTIVTLLRLISRPDADATSAAFALGGLHALVVQVLVLNYYPLQPI